MFISSIGDARLAVQLSLRSAQVDLHQWMRHLLAEHRLSLEAKLLELKEGSFMIIYLSLGICAVFCWSSKQGNGTSQSC